MKPNVSPKGHPDTKTEESVAHHLYLSRPDGSVGDGCAALSFVNTLNRCLLSDTDKQLCVETDFSPKGHPDTKIEESAAHHLYKKLFKTYPGRR